MRETQSAEDVSQRFFLVAQRFLCQARGLALFTAFIEWQNGCLLIYYDCAFGSISVLEFRLETTDLGECQTTGKVLAALLGPDETINTEPIVTGTALDLNCYKIKDTLVSTAGLRMTVGPNLGFGGTGVP